MPRPPFALGASMMLRVRGWSWRTPVSPGFSAVRTQRSVSPSMCLVRVRVRVRVRARVRERVRLRVRGLDLRRGVLLRAAHEQLVMRALQLGVARVRLVDLVKG